MLHQDFAERGQFRARVSSARRVARAVEEDQTRAIGNRGRQRAWRDLEAIRERGRHDHRFAIRQLDHVRIGDPVGRRNDRLVAGIQHRGADVVAGLLRAAGHEYLVRRVLEIVFAAELIDDRGFQRRGAVYIRVFRLAVVDRLDGGRLDMCRACRSPALRRRGRSRRAPAREARRRAR